MREILFKSKRIDDGEWIQGSLFVEGKRTEIVRGTCNGVGIEGVSVDPDTICQYTGLTDKNGNKIWENDIIGYYSEFNEKWYMGIVSYGEFNCSCCNGVYGWTFGDEDIRDYSSYEVIGNTFDNPDLLKGE